MKCIYVGSFPPPYGGVTIKNNMLFNGLSRLIECEKVDLSRVKRIDVNQVIKFIKVLFNRNSVFIIGTAGVWRRRLSQLLYYVNETALSESILIVMGGKSAEIIAQDENFLKYVSKYKRIYVEANGMKRELENKGLTNIAIFPNCRSLPQYELEVNETSSDNIRLVYFSQISREKGADLVFEVAKILDENCINYEIDFYGPVNEKFEEYFFANIDEFSNIKYCGIFKADEEDVYKKLNKYDALLFPTRWKHEGVPGILVESKIAGVPSIVSDINYNAEIINDGIDGIVMNENNALHLYNAISKLYSDRDLLSKMKYSAKADSVKYSIDEYIKIILNDIYYGRN